ncbi:lysoplasmalogenase [Nocardioides ungokensis]|uniref:lysoplasmalogenase n=1 Tax=Nocardioides ungokensis TaxID=1643322 RepID=UPI0015DFFD40|nr:lysoplasmalogenase [Nocardioides ungokensis]
MNDELVWLLPAVVAPVDWWAVARGDRRTETWAKPATLVALIVAATVLGAPDSTPGRWLLLALGFGLLGDIALLGDSLTRFRAGVAAFLVGHLAYLACFATLGLPRPAWSWAVLLVLLGSFVATREVLPATHRLDGAALSVPVAVYTAAIGAMLVCAWFTGEWLVALGATVFVASDATLSVDRFVRPIPRAHLVVMVTYHLGQALIVAGVLAATG